ncbi:MAG: PIN/TRAM domain-containing protein [Planctomycetes bacterium]|nr:PIN/TRAM domain-containing protein [Planctomycetota bacterium]
MTLTDPPKPPAPSLDIPVLTLRALFLASAVGLGLYVATDWDAPELQFVAMIVAGALALLVIAVDALAVARSSIATVSAIVFGLLVGFLASQLFVGIVSLVGDYEGPQGKRLLQTIRLAVTLIFCYLGPVFILRTKDDLRFIVPYVEFQKQAKGPRPLVLDTSAIIDGRVVDVARARVFDAPFVVPRFVLEELQRIADSGDKNRRERGRLGLDRLKTLQTLAEVQLTGGAGQLDVEVDRALIEVAQARGGKLVTVDYNLQKVADLEGVPVINMNEVAEATRTQHLPGEPLRLKVVRAGEGQHQGVGYLPDGTMVVVEGARKHKGEVVSAVITSSIQSSAGRMIFARMTTGEPAAGEPAAAAADEAAGPGGEA